MLLNYSASAKPNPPLMPYALCLFHLLVSIAARRICLSLSTLTFSRYESVKSSLKLPLNFRIRLFSCGLLNETINADNFSNLFADVMAFPHKFHTLNIKDKLSIGLLNTPVNLQFPGWPKKMAQKKIILITIENSRFVRGNLLSNKYLPFYSRAFTTPKGILFPNQKKRWPFPQCLIIYSHENKFA